ncbi:MAG: CxxxxCH/CxxCH domain-containing protein [Calditrichaeota bacterium]|nr:MAG: CxxxxCH/CxxCH domain-containing protein [Calditrichota bacterium]
MLINNKIILVLSFAFLLVYACTDQKDIPVGPNTVDVHAVGWADKTSDNFHGDDIAAANYDMQSCQQCHGANYAGGLVESSCLTCHTQQNGPEACNTCHGTFAASASDITNSAPESGAHDLHLEYFGDPVVSCAGCHAIPETLNAVGHIDTATGAEVIITDTLATLTTDAGQLILQPAYNQTTNSCQNIYCHGGWKLPKSGSELSSFYTTDYMEGNFASPVWNDAGTATCGSCHGLPPKGHREVEPTSCGTCHNGVVDAEGKIIDATKHINGKVNVFGNEYDMF